MPKGRRVDNPIRSRALVTPESGAHPRITPIDARRAEDFAEPDPLLLSLAAATDAGELSETRASLQQRDETIQSLESRVQQLEAELQTARESLRIKDVELHSLHSLRVPAAARTPSIAEAAPSMPPAAGGQAYPVLHNVAVALRASTLPPSDGDATPPSQRRAPRRACEIELEFTEETHFFTGLTQDISEGGVFIATYQLFAIGTRLELAFELPDGTRVNTWGRVRWLREESASGCRPGMGIEFGELSESILKKIAHFCEQRPPLYMEV